MKLDLGYTLGFSLSESQLAEVFDIQMLQLLLTQGLYVLLVNLGLNVRHQD